MIGLFISVCLDKMIGPDDASLVHIVHASSKCSDERAHPRSLARASATRRYKVRT